MRNALTFLGSRSLTFLSILQTDEQFPGIDSTREGLQMNDNGSVTVYFGAQVPKGNENNWEPCWTRAST